MRRIETQTEKSIIKLVDKDSNNQSYFHFNVFLQFLRGPHMMPTSFGRYRD